MRLTEWLLRISAPVLERFANWRKPESGGWVSPWHWACECVEEHARDVSVCPACRETRPASVRWVYSFVANDLRYLVAVTCGEPSAGSVDVFSWAAPAKPVVTGAKWTGTELRAAGCVRVAPELGAVVLEGAAMRLAKALGHGTEDERVGGDGL